jgi:SAM-dependent methyltransferase
MIEHNNRKYYNWSVYYITEVFLNKYIPYFKGHLYDLGCGTRPYESFLIKFCEKYIGVDWGDTLHDLKADIVGDLNSKLPIEDEKADTIFSISVMEHLHEPQIFLNESYRILKKEGYLVLQVPFMWHIHEEPYDYFRYTKYGLEKMLSKAGFNVISIEASTGFWLTWFLKLNYQLIRVINGESLKIKLVRPFLKIFIKKNQNLAIYLDKKWPNSEKETQGYWVIAKK